MSAKSGSLPRRWWHVLALAGLLAAAAAGGGAALERWRFGSSDEATFERVARETRARFAEMAGSLRATAASLATRGAVVSSLARGDEDDGRLLFEIVGAAIGPPPAGDLAVTVYGGAGDARAWSGRPSEIPAARIAGEAALFVAPGPLGLRLVAVQPVIERRGSSAAPEETRRLGAVAVERVLSPSSGVRGPAPEPFVFPTSIAPVSLRARYEGAGDVQRPYTFALSSLAGEPLLEASVSPADLARARQEWRLRVRGVALALAALTLLLLAGPLLDWRVTTRDRPSYLRALGALAAVVLGARLLLWLAVPARWSGASLRSPAAYASTAFGPFLRSPLDLLLTALTLMALVVLAADAAGRWRIMAARARRTPDAGRLGRFLGCQLAGGAILAALLVAYAAFLRDTVDNTTVDALHYSLHPWDPGRLALMFALLFFHDAVVWIGVVVLVVALAPWRLRRSSVTLASATLAAWLVPLVALLAIARERGWDVPVAPTLVVGVACAIAARSTRWAIAWYRHAPQASRFLALIVALLLPALLFYPSMLHFADRAKRRLIERQFAVQAATHSQELQVRLAQSLRQIDAIPGLADLVASLEASATDMPQTDTAFLIWRRTDLASFRLTSAVELYGSSGALRSRFALNFPEYSPVQTASEGMRCDWDVFGEVVPFGSEERRTLHAERAICEAGPSSRQRAGTIVVHVMLDYRTLPFISSQSPYFELFRVTRVAQQEGTPSRDIELVIYGWGRSPVFTSGPGAWPLDDRTFARIYASREPFWTSLAKGNSRYHVYIVNDRGGIYALGYPALGAFDHLVHLAEIATLAGLAFVVLVAGSALLTRAARDRTALGRALWREIRTSFYRRLFLAFVAAASVPALLLALGIRAYFAAELRGDVEAGASRTAAVAQRVIEESAAIQQRSDEATTPISDDVLVWISQVIDEGVNIFDGPRLVATSERDLFASGLLPTRTPDHVYRAIVLQRLSSFVGEDWIGDFRYLLAAAPVLAGGRDAILTVPLVPRQQEIEREIDELDRTILLGAVLFILLGAAIGYSVAERIADPVKRLTRATRRIARGDFDARVVARSADELQRLVEAFNRMAAELKAQRARLERTHRLEAWAEMARQVAHEIKNPLTPIQLSADHLLRVHADRGEPLAPVLQSCVESILSQVRLLRQIAAEFSSFASSPSARPVQTSLAGLVREVIEPYREGLKDRIAIAIDVPATLPLLHLDRVLIARALTNIIENALHAMPGRGELAITARHENGRVRLSVADNGVGMDEEALGRIFEPYFSTKATGTGLGLTIAKRNVELNGGSIEVRSTKGAGTTVTLTFAVEAQTAA